MEESHECIESVFISADDEPAEWSREQPTPGCLAVPAPGGVRGAFGGAAFQRYQTTRSRIVRGERFLWWQLTFPRIIDAESHGLISALKNRPAFWIWAWWKIAEPDYDAVFGSGP